MKLKSLEKSLFALLLFSFFQSIFAAQQDQVVRVLSLAKAIYQNYVFFNKQEVQQVITEETAADSQNLWLSMTDLAGANTYIVIGTGSREEINISKRSGLSTLQTITTPNSNIAKTFEKNGILFSLVQGDPYVYLYVQDGKGNYIGHAKLDGLKQIPTQVQWEGAYIYDNPIINHKTTSVILQTTSATPVPLVSSVILPQFVQEVITEVDANLSNQLWLEMTDLATNKVYAFIQSGTKGAQAIYNDPNLANLKTITTVNSTLAQTFVSSGILFSLVQVGAQVYVYVQDGKGNYIGHALLPGLTSVPTQVQWNGAYIYGPKGNGYVTNPTITSVVLQTTAATPVPLVNFTTVPPYPWQN